MKSAGERLEEFRKHKDEYFASGAHSPIDPDHQAAFQGLDYFSFDPTLDFELELEPSVEETAITLDTSDHQTVEFLIAGTITFDVAGSTQRLTVLKDRDRGRFFLPFADATSGRETYAGGRYLDPQAKPNGRLVVDFNYAYNPYCAYSDGWSCPLPPERNILDVPISAGEKNYVIPS